MTKSDKIALDMSTLPLGEHVLDYALDDAFFAGLEQDEILGGRCRATVQVTMRELNATLRISIQGIVQVSCDRCLDPMEVLLQPIEETVLLKLAAQDGEDDNAIYVAESHPIFDLAWLLYELIAVSLPVVHSHPDGECNPQMAKILSDLSVENDLSNEE